MIARVWVARATRQGAVDYTAFFKAYWLPKLPSYSGYRGVTAQTREVNDVIEITLTTFWDSLEAALAFGSAGKKDRLFTKCEPTYLNITKCDLDISGNYYMRLLTYLKPT